MKTTIVLGEAVTGLSECIDQLQSVYEIVESFELEQATEKQEESKDPFVTAWRAAEELCNAGSDASWETVDDVINGLCDVIEIQQAKIQELEQCQKD